MTVVILRRRLLSDPMATLFLAAAGAAIGAILAGGAAVAYVVRQPVIFESIARVLVDQPHLIAISDTEGEIEKLSDLRHKYGFLLRTWTLTVPTARRVGLTRNEIEGAVHALLPARSTSLYVRARSSSAVNSQRIANTISEELIGYVSARQDREDVRPDRRIDLTLAEPARRGIKAEPSRLRLASIVGVSGALGAVAGSLLFRRLLAGVCGS